MANSDASRSEARPPTIEDLKKLCSMLNEAGAEYIVIGGMSMIYHGYTRTTEDIDLLVNPSIENVSKIKAALEKLPDGIAREIMPEDVIKYSTVRVADEFVVDLMKKACDVDFESVTGHIEYFELDGIKIPFLSAEKMLETKKGIRPKDQQDALFLKWKLKNQ